MAIDLPLLIFYKSGDTHVLTGISVLLWLGQLIFSPAGKWMMVNLQAAPRTYLHGLRTPGNLEMT
jgi:hypothetical protein